LRFKSGSRASASHRLCVRAVHPERFDAMWADVPRRPWIARPRNGRFELLLNQLSPPHQIVEAIRDFSDGAFAPEVRKVRGQPFREPDSV
jgi:hypothetical protein